VPVGKELFTIDILLLKCLDGLPARHGMDDVEQGSGWYWCIQAIHKADVLLSDKDVYEGT
jgi:hypothetical protein